MMQTVDNKKWPCAWVEDPIGGGSAGRSSSSGGGVAVVVVGVAKSSSRKNNQSSSNTFWPSDSRVELDPRRLVTGKGMT